MYTHIIYVYIYVYMCVQICICGCTEIRLHTCHHIQRSHFARHLLKQSSVTSPAYHAAMQDSRRDSQILLLGLPVGMDCMRGCEFSRTAGCHCGRMSKRNSDGTAGAADVMMFKLVLLLLLLLL